MPLNSYATLGRSGLRVSPFCLGAMTFGEDWGWGTTPEGSAKILGAFLERGGNFVDTANFYTKGHSEKIIGDFIAQDRGCYETRHTAMCPARITSEKYYFPVAINMQSASHHYGVLLKATTQSTMLFRADGDIVSSI
jgi:predicted aldo/keto reductase-like oxidoreductase